MLETFRKFSKHIVFKILFGLLLLSFVVTSVHGVSSLSFSEKYRVKVGNERITQEVIDGKYDQTVRNIRRSGLDFSDEQLVSMGISKEQILRNKGHDSVSRQEIADLGLEVGDEAIADQIKNIPQFQTAGNFDREKFNSAIASMGLRESQFTASLRNEIKNTMLMNAIGLNVPVNDFIAEKQARHYGETRDIEVAIIPKEYKKVTETPIEEDLVAFYNEHSYEFQIPESRDINYIVLKKTKENESALYDTTTKIEDELAAGSTLAEIAGKLSLKVESRNAVTNDEAGQALGLSPLFLETAFGKEKGQISDLVLDEKNNQYYIIEVKDVKAVRIPELSEVRQEAIEAWQDDETNNQNLKFIADLAEKLKSSGEDLSAFAAKSGFKYDVIDGVKRADTEVHGARLVNESFRAKPGEVIGSFQNEDGTYKIAKLKSVKAANLSPDQIKEYRLSMGEAMRAEIVDEYFEYLKTKFPVVENKEAAAKVEGPVKPVPEDELVEGE